MQRGDSRKQGAPVRVTDLREQLRASSAKAPKALKEPPNPSRPPKAKKSAALDPLEERAEKAEKLAHIQHSTSLLTREPKNKRGKPPKEGRSGGGFLLQLVLVMGVAGGVAYSLDPSIVNAIDWRELKDMAGI